MANFKNLISGFLAISYISLFSQNSLKQGNWCGMDAYLLQQFKENPKYKDDYYESLRKIRENVLNMQVNKKNTDSLIIVPVVVHILHYNGIGNISKEQVEDGIRVLNEDYRRLNADTSNTRSIFKPFAADTKIEFRLARIDPNGNCTEGITRVNTCLSYNATNAIKSLSYWPSDKYFNIWLVNSIASFGGGPIFGYGQFPGVGSWNTYGFVVRNDQWGTIGTSISDGRTATHELAHCFGLFHTFQSGCGSICDNTGDYVCDTPPVANATYSCDLLQNTCSNDASGSSPYTSDVNDQIENYMSYDACRNMFTQGQKTRMRATIASFSQLLNLISYANLIATGTDSASYSSPQPLCAPIAYFIDNISYTTTGYLYNNYLCEDDPVNLIDISYNGTVSTRTWTVPGATPITSLSDSILTLKYDSAGIYDVSLSVSNNTGSDQITETQFFNVLSTSADYISADIYETFASSSTFNSKWIVDQCNNDETWVWDTIGYNDKGGIKIFNYTISQEGRKDVLITPSIDFASDSDASYFTFKVAYARRNSNSSDNLAVYYSTNCGKTWILRYNKSGSALATDNNFYNAPFVPTSTSQWREESLLLPSNVLTSTNVRFMFVFTSSGSGNNLYIDDVRLGNALFTSIDKNNLNVFSVKLYPNPVHSKFHLLINAPQENNINFELYDLLGKKVKNLYNLQNIKGKFNITFDIKDIPQGIYFLKINTDYEKISKKIVKIDK